MRIRFFFWVVIASGVLPANELQAQTNPPAYNEAFDKANAVLQDWNTAINSRETDQLFDLYSEFVNGYGSQVAKGELIQGKANWLGKHPSYKQEIVEGSLHWFAYEYDEAPRTLEARFTKKCLEGGSKSDYEAYLKFEQENGEWRITVESDLTTDRNLAKKAIAMPLTNGNYCLMNEVYQDVRESGLGHFGPIRITYDLSLSIQDKKVVGGYFNYYSGFMRILQEWKIISGFQNVMNELELRVQKLDEAELEPTGPIYTLKIKPLSNETWVMTSDPSKVFQELEWWNIGCEE